MSANFMVNNYYEQINGHYRVYFLFYSNKENIDKSFHYQEKESSKGTPILTENKEKKITKITKITKINLRILLFFHTLDHLLTLFIYIPSF